MNEFDLSQAFEIAHRFAEFSKEFRGKETRYVVIGAFIFAVQAARTSETRDTSKQLTIVRILNEGMNLAERKQKEEELPDPFVQKLVEVSKSGPASLREFFNQIENAVSKTNSELDSIVKKAVSEDPKGEK